MLLYALSIQGNVTTAPKAMISWSSLSFALALHTTLFSALLHQEHFCHALLPQCCNSKILWKPSNARKRISPSVYRYIDFHSDNQDETARHAISHRRRDFHRPVVRGGGGEKNNFFSAISPANAIRATEEGFRQRIAADPEFISKTIFEVIITASTHCIARGRRNILPEIDFVIAAILTGVFGRYYAMWSVARTKDYQVGPEKNDDEKGSNIPNATSWRDKVPTNAFQPTLLDGRTRPTLASRFLAIILPMPKLFRAGFIASTVGYGLTWFLIQLRTMLIPHYVAATKPVSVPHAAIYTGFFMAIVSNTRYQLLQGIVEPFMIDGLFSKIEEIGGHKENEEGTMLGWVTFSRQLKRVTIISVRYAGGLLGSSLNIQGMKAFGLQKLK